MCTLFLLTIWAKSATLKSRHRFQSSMPQREHVLVLNNSVPFTNYKSFCYFFLKNFSFSSFSWIKNESGWMIHSKKQFNCVWSCLVKDFVFFDRFQPLGWFSTYPSPSFMIFCSWHVEKQISSNLETCSTIKCGSPTQTPNKLPENLQIRINSILSLFIFHTCFAYIFWFDKYLHLYVTK